MAIELYKHKTEVEEINYSGQIPEGTSLLELKQEVAKLPDTVPHGVVVEIMFLYREKKLLSGTQPR